MYKVLFADDEAQIREAIRENIPWEELGFSFMGACENGKQAMELLEAGQSDLLLTDIHMPLVDGMELIRFVYENYPDTKVIILSGCESFAYAKQALKYQVLEYLLKPVDFSELVETLTRVKRMFDEKKESRNDMRKIRSAYVSSLPMIQSSYLHHILFGVTNHLKLTDKEKEFRSTLQAECYNIAIVEADSLEPFTGLYEDVKDELALFAIYNIVEEIVTGKGCGIVFETPSEQTAILFMGDNPWELKKVRQEILPEIQRAIRQFLEIRVTIAVGKTVSSLEELSDSYEDTKIALEHRFMLGGNRIIEAEDYGGGDGSSEVVDVFGMAEKIAGAIRRNQETEIVKLAEEFNIQLKECYVDKNRSIVYTQNLVLFVFSLLPIEEKAAKKIRAGEQQFLDRIYETDDLDELSGRTKKFLLYIAECIFHNKDSYCRSQAMLALEYIEKNYADSDVTLNSVCSALAMSTSYFSAVFKNYTGETFVEALTKKRIEKAKALLEQSGKRTYEIAELVGFGDAHYFSVTFKKLTGKTPREYAKQFKK